MKFLITSIFIGMLVLPTMSQQLPQYTLVQENPYIYNSAYAGMNNTLEILAGYRSQWKDMPGNPTQYVLSGHLPIYRFNSALGFMYESDNLGPESWNKVGLSLGYVYPTPVGLFSISGRAFYEQLEFRGSELITRDGNYEGNIIDHNDPLLPNSDVSSPAMRIDIGVWFKSSSYEVGISYNDAYHSGFSLNADHKYVQAGVMVLAGRYIFPLSDEIGISSILIIKSDFVALQSQLALNAIYQDHYFLGIELTGHSPKSFDQLGIQAGMKLNNYISFIYQYGVGLSALRDVHSGSHEVAIKYTLGRPPGSMVLPKIIYNPRYVE